MLDFIYDSLDTVKKLKFPTLKQITQLTIAIFALVIVAGAYFILADSVFSGGYKAFYAAMTDGKTPTTAITAWSGETKTTTPEVQTESGAPSETTSSGTAQ